MSRDIIEVNLHYGKEDFKRLFEVLLKSTIATEELQYKGSKSLYCSGNTTGLPSAKESSNGDI